MADVVDVEDDLVRSRQGIRHEIGLALYVADIGRKLGNARELVRLTECLRIRFFMDRRHETLVICVEGEGAPLHPIAEMSCSLVGGEQFPVVGRPKALVGFQL